MGKYVAENTVKCLAARGRALNGATVTVLGLAFKEDCADCRNSKVVDVIRELRSYGITVWSHDPRVAPTEARKEYGIELASWEAIPASDALVMAVAHSEFLGMPLEALLAKVKPDGCVIDVKSALDAQAVRSRGFALWRL
jgi:UDP-N-acetyl-D-galactosamine dehydrogenase